MKRFAPVLLLSSALTVALSLADAQTARIQYTPAAGTKTRYQTVTKTSAQVLDFAATGISAEQQAQAKQQLVSATSTQTTIDSSETVQKPAADGSRRVNSVLTMTISTGASAQTLKAGFDTVTLYRASGGVEIEQFKLDKKRTDANLASALEANSSSFKNLFSQASAFSFYGKTLSATPTEVVAEIPAPAMAANLNLKYRTRTTYTLLGRTANGGVRIGTTTQLEPVNYSGTQQGAKVTLKMEATPAKGEITLLPDGRIENASTPSDLTLTTNTSASNGSLRYTLRIKTTTDIRIVR
ncbi:MAG: hypothetical protein HC933_02615 [Pleurocapsa sp. SU_196_0]|nr:hypothetical protein [Pleurocapsa sp. SU_196_0]